MLPLASYVCLFGIWLSFPSQWIQWYFMYTNLQPFNYKPKLLCITAPTSSFPCHLNKSGRNTTAAFANNLNYKILLIFVISLGHSILFFTTGQAAVYLHVSHLANMAMIWPQLLHNPAQYEWHAQQKNNKKTTTENWHNTLYNLNEIDLSCT